MTHPPSVVPVSVVIPAYERAHTIGRAVLSAARQKPAPPAEIIVVDDGSTDETGAVAAEAGARVITHEVNRGEGAARNSGIAAASHEWIALLDSDDEWMPDLLATLWPLRSSHVVVGGGSLNRRSDGTENYNGATGRRPLVLRSPAALVYPENFIAASGTMVRRDVVRSVGGYAEGMPAAADMDLWIRVLERGTAVIIPRPVVVYHIHDGQVTNDADLMSRAHRATALRYRDRDWWQARRLALWEGARSYDLLRRSLHTRAPADAARHVVDLLRSPLRLAGALGIAIRRFRLAHHVVLADADPTTATPRAAGGPNLRRRRASPTSKRG